MQKNKTQLYIIMGSISDLPTFKEAEELLKDFNIGYEVKVLSAHRTPKLLEQTLDSMPKNIKVIIAAAGGAAHLAGVVASKTLLPVLGVPMDSKLKGVDSFVSTSQMPAGIPVPTFSIGKAGAINAVLSAASIIALNDDKMAGQLQKYRNNMVTKIKATNKELSASRKVKK